MSVSTFSIAMALHTWPRERGSGKEREREKEERNDCWSLFHCVWKTFIIIYDYYFLTLHCPTFNVFPFIIDRSTRAKRIDGVERHCSVFCQCAFMCARVRHVMMSANVHKSPNNEMAFSRADEAERWQNETKSAAHVRLGDDIIKYNARRETAMMEVVRLAGRHAVNEYEVARGHLRLPKQQR